jgi:hypothetical protein
VTPAVWPLTRTRFRSVVLHTPITGLRFASPFSATSLNGTCNAIVLTLYPATVS